MWCSRYSSRWIGVVGSLVVVVGGVVGVVVDVVGVVSGCLIVEVWGICSNFIWWYSRWYCSRSRGVENVGLGVISCIVFCLVVVVSSKIDLV